MLLQISSVLLVFFDCTTLCHCRCGYCVKQNTHWMERWTKQSFSYLDMLGPTDEVIHCGFQSGLWTELSVPECPLLLQLQIFKDSSPPSIHVAAQHAVEKCKLPRQQAQRTSPHCSDTRSCQSEDLRNTKQVSTELLSLQRKGATSFLLCRLSSNLAQQEQHCSTLEP